MMCENMLKHSVSFSVNMFFSEAPFSGETSVVQELSQAANLIRQGERWWSSGHATLHATNYRNVTNETRNTNTSLYVLDPLAWNMFVNVDGIAHMAES